MKKTSLRKIPALLLAAVMLMTMLPFAASAADEEYGFYYADSNKTLVILDDLKSAVPEDGEIIIPSEYEGCRVVGIASYTFYKLTGLKSVVIPESVILVEENAFYGCTDIENVTVNSASCEIGTDVFVNTAWYKNHRSDYIVCGTTLLYYTGTDEEVYIPFNITKIGNGAFKDNKTVKRVYLTDAVTDIGSKAFFGCSSFEELVVPEGTFLKNIGSFAFDGTKWIDETEGDFVILGKTLIRYKGTDSEVVIPNSVERISDYAFEVKTKDIASRVTVPASVVEFGKECFFLYKSANNVYPQLFVYPSTPAQSYLDKNGISYKTLCKPADITADGKVTTNDARELLRFIAGINGGLSDIAKRSADVNRDGRITTNDVKMILRIVSGLTGYTADDMLSMPASAYDTLELVCNAVSEARAGASFTMNAYQEITDYNMNVNTRMYLGDFRNELTSEKDSVTDSFEAGSDEAVKALCASVLTDTSVLKSCSCVFTADNKYDIKIVFRDETVDSSDVNKTAAVSKLMPVDTLARYQSVLEGKYWYRASTTSFDYSVTYTDCTLEAVIDVATNHIEALRCVMNYDFAVSNGRIMSLAINDNCTARRTDTVYCTDFIYE